MIQHLPNFKSELYEQFRTPDQLACVSFFSLSADEIDRLAEDVLDWEWEKTTCQLWVIPFEDYEAFCRAYKKSLMTRIRGDEAFDRYDDEVFLVAQWHDPHKQWAVVAALNSCLLDIDVPLQDKWFQFSSLPDANYYPKIFHDLERNINKPQFPTLDVVGILADMRLDYSYSKQDFLLSFLQPLPNWKPMNLSSRQAIEEYLCQEQLQVLQSAVAHHDLKDNLKRKI